MNDSVLQILVLAGIAIFLILRLRSVLGTRDGFEPPQQEVSEATTPVRRDFEVIEGGPVEQIADFVDPASPAGRALAAMKEAEPDFSISDFIAGARSAYEMILMAFETGELEPVRPFLDPDVYESFEQAVADRAAQGLTVEAQFYGVANVQIVAAEFDRATAEAEITLSFVGELTSAVRDASGAVVDGDPRKLRKQKDVWTFARQMGRDDPNWILVATGG